MFCDQTTAGGGWTVFQKRLDGSVDFYRGWDDYKRGFGNLNGEFWLGLDKIHRLTKERSRLRVDLEDTTGKTAYAEYDFFGVASERSKYKLSLGTYSGMYFETPKPAFLPLPPPPPALLPLPHPSLSLNRSTDSWLLSSTCVLLNANNLLLYWPWRRSNNRRKYAIYYPWPLHTYTYIHTYINFI